MNVRKYYIFDEDLNVAKRIRELLNERKVFNRKYQQFLKETDFSRKNEGRIINHDVYLKTDKYRFTPKKPYIVIATRYDWGIANLVPSDKRQELVSNTPKQVSFLTNAKTKHDAAIKVSKYLTPKNIKSSARVYGCLYIPWILKEFPIYHLEAGINDCVPTDWSKASGLPIINLNKLKKVNNSKPYLYKSNQKTDTTKYFNSDYQLRIDYYKRNTQKFLRPWVNTKKILPEFYKDKLLVFHEKDTTKIVKIRSSVYYNEDSPYSKNTNLKRGYPSISKLKVSDNKSSIDKQKISKPL